jgi:hypothetical protein
MIPDISISCDATFGAGSENFGTVNGNVLFQSGSANSGVVNGNAVLEGNAEHKAGASITGNVVRSASAVISGSVTGTVGYTQQAEGELYAIWLAANTGVNQYSGPGEKNGQWAYGSTEYASQTLADLQQAVDIEAADYSSWLALNVGVNQFSSSGVHNGQWAYGSFEHVSQNAAKLAQEAVEYPAWLASNVGLSQNPWGVFGSSNPLWAYNSTAYVTEQGARDAQAADDAANEAAAQESAYQGWLAANTGVNQYSGPGEKNGQWAYNQTEYPSQVEAQAAYDAANAGGTSGWAPPWTPGNFYNTGDRVTFEGSTYEVVSMLNNLNDPPSTGSGWSFVS